LARLVADAGLLIAAQRNDRNAWAIKREAAVENLPIVVPAAVIAQAWRGDGRGDLRRYLKGLHVIPFGTVLAQLAGELLGSAGTSDVVDAAVVVSAVDGDRIITSDVRDISFLLEHWTIRAEVVGI
jgi:hypothetical protein